MEFLMASKNDIDNYIENNFGFFTRKDGKKTSKKKHMEFYTLEEKKIVPRKRKIIKSDIFECPESLREGWKSLKTIIRSGGDLNPYRSNSADKTQKPDPLLYEWNIYHIHFQTGRRYKNNGPDHLLYCIIENDVLYAIKIAGHGFFQSQVLLECVVRNWPHLVTEVVGIKGEALTEKDRAGLRSKNINSYTSINGKAYSPKKISGVLTSGHPISAYLQSTLDLRLLTKIRDDRFWDSNIIMKVHKYLRSVNKNPLLVIIVLDITLQDKKMNLKLNLHCRYRNDYELIEWPIQVTPPVNIRNGML